MRKDSTQLIPIVYGLLFLRFAGVNVAAQILNRIIANIRMHPRMLSRLGLISGVPPWFPCVVNLVAGHMYMLMTRYGVILQKNVFILSTAPARHMVRNAFLERKLSCAEAAYANSRAVPRSLPKGVPYMFHGWVDAQGSGIPADYCHYVIGPGDTCVARDQDSSMTSFYVAHVTNAASLVWSQTLQILLNLAGPYLPALSPPLKIPSLRRRDITQRASVG
jgi:hypothetical protein